jgi:hypothetical protein
VGKPEQLGRPRHKWEDTIKMDFREIGWGIMGWINMVRNRDQWRAFVKTVMNLLVP